MNSGPVSATLDFEVYVLMTMKLTITMSRREAQLQVKLAQRGLSVGDAERIHGQVAEALGDESCYFSNMTSLLDLRDQAATSRQFRSVMWPGFDFTATAGDDGRLDSRCGVQSGRAPACRWPGWTRAIRVGVATPEMLGGGFATTATTNDGTAGCRQTLPYITVCPELSIAAARSHLARRRGPASPSVMVHRTPVDNHSAWSAARRVSRLRR